MKDGSLEKIPKAFSMSMRELFSRIEIINSYMPYIESNG